MQTTEITEFEFSLTLGKNIVIQRFFNVTNYNPVSKNSLDLHDCVTDICEEISNDLKSKTLDYLNDNASYFLDPERVENSVINNDDEQFLLVVKLKNEPLIMRGFPSQVYHPKVRYSVDIRPKIRKYLLELSEVLSSKDLVTNYLEYDLN